MIIDDFLKADDFADLRELSIEGPFADEMNQMDGVEYPYICRVIPQEIYTAVANGIETALEQSVMIDTMFLRASPEDVHCPHIVHHDASMGEITFLLYLNEKKQCRGGTALVDSLDVLTTEEAQEKANDPSQWFTTHLFPMWPNRGVLFPAHLYHRAEPVGGFGTVPSERRVVLTAFLRVQS